MISWPGSSISWTGSKKSWTPPVHDIMAGVQYIMDGVQEIMDSARYCIVTDFMDIIILQVPLSTCVVGSSAYGCHYYFVDNFHDWRWESYCCLWDDHFDTGSRPSVDLGLDTGSRSY